MKGTVNVCGPSVPSAFSQGISPPPLPVVLAGSSIRVPLASSAKEGRLPKASPSEPLSQDPEPSLAPQGPKKDPLIVPKKSHP